MLVELLTVSLFSHRLIKEVRITAKEKVFIFAVDSALGVLHREGINPDATFSIDAEKDASACVPAGMPIGTTFLSSKSPPDWLGQDAVQSLFLSGNNLTEDWLEKF